MADQSGMVLPCEEKRRLFLAYQAATANYSHIVKELATTAGLAVRTEFELVQGKVKGAKTLVSEARERLDQHRLQHKC
jgi:hypothetical protein